MWTVVVYFVGLMTFVPIQNAGQVVGYRAVLIDDAQVGLAAHHSIIANDLGYVKCGWSGGPIEFSGFTESNNTFSRDWTSLGSSRFPTPSNTGSMRWVLGMRHAYNADQNYGGNGKERSWVNLGHGDVASACPVTIKENGEWRVPIASVQNGANQYWNRSISEAVSVTFQMEASESFKITGINNPYKLPKPGSGSCPDPCTVEFVVGNLPVTPPMNGQLSAPHFAGHYKLVSNPTSSPGVPILDEHDYEVVNANCASPIRAVLAGYSWPNNCPRSKPVLTYIGNGASCPLSSFP